MAKFPHSDVYHSRSSHVLAPFECPGCTDDARLWGEPMPNPPPKDPAKALAGSRAIKAEQIEHERLRAAVDAMRSLGFDRTANDLADASVDFDDAIRQARHDARMLRVSLADGSDEDRYKAAGKALEALGALWAVS